MRFTKETARRAARTFLQAFVGYLVVNLPIVDFGAEKAVLKSALIGILVSAAAAGIAALMNVERDEDDGS